MTARKIALLLLILGAGAVLETAWAVRGHVDIGPEGCRVLGGRFYGPSYAFEDTARTEAPAGARLEVKNAFGRVQVVAGEAGEVKLTLRKVVFRPTESEAREFADRVSARLESTAGVVRVETNRDAVGRDDRVGFETHLSLVVPPGTPVTVTNEHGAVEVEDAASADVTSSFDDVRVLRVKGAVAVKSRHGDVSVSEVEGALTLSGRHGDVEVRNVGGRATLETQHGSVTATAVGGLEVDHAHGDVAVDDVRGDLRVTNSHGGVVARGVRGKASVETSFSDVLITDVDADARVKVEHGGATLREIKGAVVAEATHDDVELTDVEGPAEVTVAHGGVRAKGVEKGVKVKASGEDVDLDGVRGAVHVDQERGSVRVAHRGPLSEPIEIRARQGGIRLEIPAGSRFELQAEARRGDVDVDVSGLTLTRDEKTAHGSVGTGGALVKLSADGDVTVEERTATASGEL
jgi:Putative adhesin